jgi:hypothetical protein
MTPEEFKHRHRRALRIEVVAWTEVAIAIALSWWLFFKLFS